MRNERKISLLLFLVFVLSAFSSVLRAEGLLDVTKFIAKSGKSRTDHKDQVQFLGLMDATDQDLLAVLDANDIVVSFDCNDLLSPLEWTFPVNSDSYKNGKYNYARTENASQSFFKYDPANGKVLFKVKNGDLTGLSCPMTVTITIGSYSAQVELDEEIVNGTKKPCPPQFLMGVRSTMTVDKILSKLGAKPGTDSVTAQGYFSVAGDCDMSSPMIAELGDQTLTVEGINFTPNATGTIEQCRSASSQEGPLVTAKFDFANCKYKLQVKNAVIEESGPVDFGIDCFGNDLPDQPVDLPSPSCQRYELERYRCYDQLGRDWTYSASYSIEDSEGMTDTSGTTSGTISVAGSPVYIDGHECYSVSASTPDSTVSTSWYEDYYGTHQYGWGNFNDLISYDIEMDALLAMPKQLCVGQTYCDTGTFEGDYDLDLGPYSLDIDIYDFKGTAKTCTTLLGFEPITVSYGTFPSAAKIQTNLVLNGTMRIEVDYYGQILRAKANFQMTMNQMAWGVEDMGMVKVETEMLVKMSVAGENIWVRMTETDQLTSYSP